MAALKGLPRGERLEFVRLRAIVNATEGNLGAHIGTLENAGYIKVEKDFNGKKPRTRVSLTEPGARLRQLRRFSARPPRRRGFGRRGGEIAMNLDLIPLGWMHLIASLAAIVAALIILARPKGTSIHKRRGRIYVALILVTSATALGIYRFGVFFFPHWFAIASLATTAIAFAAARFKIPATGWVHVHLTFTLASVYILIGGGVNEIFLRVYVLRRLVPSLNSPTVGVTHLVVIVSFVVLIVYFNAREWHHRRTPTITADGDVVADRSGSPAGG